MIQEDWLDEIGCEFYFTVVDAVDQRKESSKNLVLREVSQWEFPIQQFGNSVKEYQMISSPYELDDNIEDMFEPIVGPYNPYQWRFVRYQDGKNVDYADGLSKTKMDRGRAYWLWDLGLPGYPAARVAVPA